MDVDLAEIARLEERRLAEGVASIVDAWEPLAGGTMCFGGVGSWANQAAGQGFDGPVTGDDLDRLDDFYASRGVEPRIEVCPFADGSLVAGLSDRGYVIREFGNVLVRGLGDLPAAPVEGLEVVWLDPEDPEHARACLDIKMGGFGIADASTFEPLERRMWASPRCETVLARMEGRFVAAATLEHDGPAGALIGMATLEPYRRRGIQRALTVARLERLRELGSQFACVGSSPTVSTGRNALRLGFRMAYTKVALVRTGEGLAPSP